MLRILLLLLILANLLFFVWAQGFLGSGDEGREPQRLANQLMPEKLKVEVIGLAPANAPLPAESCRLVKGLAPSEVKRLAAQVEEKLPSLHIAINTNEAPGNVYWVHIPALPNRLTAEQKLAELKKRGLINTPVILEEGGGKFTVSLGLFNTEQLANDYLQDLGRRGVRSARVQVRENLLDKIRLEVRGPAEILTKQLPDLLGGQAAVNLGECTAGK